ncbi:ArnT family glycosyltransferase [Chloroflexota bacterium]
MAKFDLVKLILIVGLITGSLIYYAISRKRDLIIPVKFFKIAFAAYAVFQILLLLLFFSNHISFPLNLEGLELTRLQHVRRAIQGLPIFVDPSPDFVPLVYQPLYYYLSVPFTWLLGDTLFTLRLVTILGTIGSGCIIFLAVRESTASKWWGLMAVGLFAAAYRAMDSYFDVASVDTWMLFMILLGCYLIGRSQSRVTDWVGVGFLVVAFWFKQPAFLFTIGGLVYLTWRKGWKKTLPYWILAVLMGPILYFLAGPVLFGPRFNYYTFEVPRQWVTFSWDSSILRVLKIIGLSYFVLAIVGASAFVIILIRSYQKLHIWYFMFPVAILSGFVGAYVDPGGNNNVFIPMGVWIILTGVIGLKDLVDLYPSAKKWGVFIPILGVSFVLLAYNPRSEFIPFKAQDDYNTFVGYLQSIDGTVYAPEIGPLERGYEFYPLMHAVAIGDLYRNGFNDEDLQVKRTLFEPLIHPKGEAYIVMDREMENHYLLSELTNIYVLDPGLDFQNLSLAGLPMRYQASGPLFRYRYSPAEAQETWQQSGSE